MKKIELIAMLTDSKKIIELLQRRGVVEISKNTDEELENTLTSQDSLFKCFSNTLKYDPSYEYIKKEDENKYKLKYQVAPNYRATAVNNDITCYVIQPSGIIEKNQKILFSQFDYDGSDYMFTLNLGQ